MSSLPTLVPTITTETAPFWRAAARGKLVLPRCDRCERYIWYPREFCPFCGSVSVTWTPVSGRGHIYSLSVVRRAPHPAFAESVPYSVAFVELEEGVRLMSNVVADDVDRLAIGDPVEAIYDRIDDSAAIVRFRSTSIDR